MIIPAKLQQLAKSESGAAWLESLPSLLQEISTNWQLELGTVFDGGTASYVVTARQYGKPVVLKIQWPHEECRFEADALRAWNGGGAVKLLMHDSQRHALLLEHCTPGVHLSASSQSDKLAVVIALLPRIWIPAQPPFKCLSQEAADWAQNAYSHWQQAGKPCAQQLLDRVLEDLAALAASQGQQVLLHQDLHGENIVSAQREPWLVIDPKPLNGEREFALASIVRSSELGHTRQATLDRLNRLSQELQLDRERVRRWTIAQTLIWSFASSAPQGQLQTVNWLLADLLAD